MEGNLGEFDENLIQKMQEDYLNKLINIIHERQEDMLIFHLQQDNNSSTQDKDKSKPTRLDRGSSTDSDQKPGLKLPEIKRAMTMSTAKTTIFNNKLESKLNNDLKDKMKVAKKDI